MYKSSTKQIPHPPSTRYDHADDGGDEFKTPEAKRRKVDNAFDELRTPVTQDTSPKKVLPSTIISPRRQRALRHDRLQDVQDENSEQSHEVKQEPKEQATNLEIALPPVRTDEEALEEYEAYKAGQLQEENAQSSDSLQSRFKNRTWTRGRNSIYVDAFNLALATVLEDEGHLFNEPERAVFKFWHELDYEAQYLYVRLFLRKTNAWHRIAKLGYFGDIADVEAATRVLQEERNLPKDETSYATERFVVPGEEILPDEAVPLGNSFRFAECSDDHISTLDEASSLLLLDELKAIAKDAKVNTTGKTKSELLRTLRRTSGKQSGLDFLKRSETEDSTMSNDTDTKSMNGEDDLEDDNTSSGTRTPTSASKSNRDQHFTKKIMATTGKCVRLSLIPLKLFERVHLVFYRSTEWTEKSLTTLLLSKISRRNFPNYIVSRSANIFESRSALLEFEASLRLQFRVDNIIEFSQMPAHRQSQEILAIFEKVYPRWRTILIAEQAKEDRLYETGEGAYLRRFSPGWVYTRVVHKTLPALARFREHKKEHSLICELLEQRLFHPARRGAWYSRRALLEEHYMHALEPNEGRGEEAQKKFWKRVALRTCEQGLQDNECHVIYHYDLQKRIMKLEKQLKIPKREQHEFGHVGLRKATERDVEGIQIVRDRGREGSTPPARLRRKDSSPAGSKDRATTPTRKGFSTKTTWLDSLDTNEHVSVEAMCLSHYRKVLGYKGYHSEGGILRTLFGLLFFEVMFETYVPNVFQTAYQTCPLDLHTDAFYSARISEINSRINEITNGDGESIIRRVWAQHAEQETCVVGVRWKEYELDDLCELVCCFGGESLGVVMRVFAQEYGSRGGGVPDLVLWKLDEVHDDHEKHENNDSELAENETNGSNGHVKKAKTGKVMFSEVKSENDRLSDTQRLWISVLLNAGIEVELCHAIAAEVRTEP